MRITLDERAVDQAIDGGFGLTSPRAQEMRVAFAHPVNRWRRGHVDVVQYDADPDAWHELADWFREHSVVSPGHPKHHQEVAPFRRCLKAAQAIEREIALLAQHPGYRGIGVAGAQVVALPARRCMGERRWWPTTHLAIVRSRRGGEVNSTTLWPEEFRSGGRVFTRWVTRPGS